MPVRQFYYDFCKTFAFIKQSSADSLLTSSVAFSRSLSLCSASRFWVWKIPKSRNKYIITIFMPMIAIGRRQFISELKLWFFGVYFFFGFVNLGNSPGNFWHNIYAAIPLLGLKTLWLTIWFLCFLMCIYLCNNTSLIERQCTANGYRTSHSEVIYLYEEIHTD